MQDNDTLQVAMRRHCKYSDICFFFRLFTLFLPSPDNQTGLTFIESTTRAIFHLFSQCLRYRLKYKILDLIHRNYLQLFLLAKLND